MKILRSLPHFRGIACWVELRNSKPRCAYDQTEELNILINNNSFSPSGIESTARRRSQSWACATAPRRPLPPTCIVIIIFIHKCENIKYYKCFYLKGGVLKCCTVSDDAIVLCTWWWPTLIVLALECWALQKISKIITITKYMILFSNRFIIY